MNTLPISRRRFVGGSLLALGTSGLTACGGGTEATTSSSSEQAGDRAYALATPGTADSIGTTTTTAVVIGTTVATLDVHGTQVGVFPYSSTVMPLQGQVPVGYTLTSPDETTLRSVVVSRWPDGSAAVIVAAGSMTLTSALDRTLRLQIAAEAANQRTQRIATPLSASRVAQVITSLSVDFGALGAASVASMGSPERIWWASTQTLCARYRLAAPAHATLEAVVDVHIWASSTRALVEVVFENAKVNSATPVKPAAASYSAILKVNGQAVASGSASGAPEGSHAAFRSWYASAWIGGDPGLRVTQVAAELQQHPLFWKMARSSSVDMVRYASDVYVPWGAGRHRGSNMGGTGDHASIGPLPQWEAHFLQTGDARAARAVEVNALAILGFNVNWRDSTTGLIPDATQLARKSMSGSTANWPRQQPGGGSGAMEWEVAHQPAAGLMAFICRPSPVFIEIAQKICVFNATWSGEITNLSGWPGTWPDNDYSGVFGNPFQIRGRAWALRNLTHATFLSPAGSSWRSGGLFWLDRNRLYLDGWRNHPKAVLNVMWDRAPNDLEDHQPSTAGFQSPVWEYHWLITELHKAASCKLLDATKQAALDTLADWCALQPIRWVNEQPDGGWRYISYDTTIGRSGTTIDSAPTWGEQRASYMIDRPPSAGGGMYSSTSAEPISYAAYAADTTASSYYPSQWWAAFVVGIERRVPGYNTAWSTVQSTLANVSGWLDGFSADPRWGSLPKAAPAVMANPAPSTAGYDAATFTWTPARDSNGLVTAASWAATPIGTFFQVADTKLDQRVLPQVLAAVPTFRDFGGEGWAAVINSWNGMAVDDRVGRERAFFLASGGHGASSNNGGYAFDLRKMDWMVVRMPTAPSNWSTAYRSGASGSFTYNPDAAAIYTANPTGGYYYDETTGERDPTARHTYLHAGFCA